MAKTTKKLLVLLGSPRKDGNSAALAAQAAAGAGAAGAQVKTVYLHGLDIHPCAACDACHRDPARGCAVDDDMQPLYPKLRAAHALVIATPVYWFTMSAQTKLFLDRCYALEGPTGNALAGKRIGLVLTYGGADPFDSGAVNALRSFQDAFRYIGAEIVGSVYGSAGGPGEIKKSKDVMERARNLGAKLVAEA